MVSIRRKAVLRIVSKVPLSVIGKLRNDGAAFTGAVICLISFFLPWVVRSWSPPRIIGGYVIPVPKVEWSFIDLLFEPEFTAVMVVVLAGIMISLFHRLGTVIQISGLLGFVLTSQSYFHSAAMGVWSDFYIGPGYFVALVGAFISVFASKNFWWQRSSHPVVPAISRVTALSPNATRTPR